MYGLAPIISVIENLGPIAAMNRSKFYSSNQIPSIAFLYIVGIIFFFIGDFVITIIFHFALGAFGKSLFDSCISYLTSMVSLIYTFILYNEVKKRA
jgi:hypothetical protein